MGVDDPTNQFDFSFDEVVDTFSRYGMFNLDSLCRSETTDTLLKISRFFKTKAAERVRGTSSRFKGGDRTAIVCIFDLV